MTSILNIDPEAALADFKASFWLNAEVSTKESMVKMKNNMHEDFFSGLAKKVKTIRKTEKVHYKCLNFKINKGPSDQNTFDVDSETRLVKKIDLTKACKYTGLKYGTCYDKFRSHKLNFTKLNRKILFDMNEVTEFILTHRIGDWSKVTCSDVEIVYKDKVDIDGCCEITGLCYDTFYTYVKKENLPHIKYGNKAVFLKDFIEEWAEGNGQKCRK